MSLPLPGPLRPTDRLLFVTSQTASTTSPAVAHPLTTTWRVAQDSDKQTQQPQREEEEEEEEEAGEEEKADGGRGEQLFDAAVLLDVGTNEDALARAFAALRGGAAVLVVERQREQQQQQPGQSWKEQVSEALLLTGFEFHETDDVTEVPSPSPSPSVQPQPLQLQIRTRVPEWVGEAVALPKPKLKPAQMSKVGGEKDARAVWAALAEAGAEAAGMEDDMEDDYELEDEDALLTAARPVKKKAFAACGPPKPGTRKRACKNCTCGLKDMEGNPAVTQEELDAALKLGCGNCAKGDAFRCGSCPYLGQPAFTKDKPPILKPASDEVKGTAVVLDLGDDDLGF